MPKANTHVLCSQSKCTLYRGDSQYTHSCQCIEWANLKCVLGKHLLFQPGIFDVKPIRMSFTIASWAADLLNCYFSRTLQVTRVVLVDVFWQALARRGLRGFAMGSACSCASLSLSLSGSSGVAHRYYILLAIQIQLRNQETRESQEACLSIQIKTWGCLFLGLVAYVIHLCDNHGNKLVWFTGCVW